MNREETAHLLTAMAAYDRRTLGQGDVIAWSALLADVPFDDGLAAVQRHYAEQTEWMMPAHVRRIVRDIERERAVGARKWAPGQYGVPKDDPMPEIERGERLTADDVSPAVLDLLSRLRTELPGVPRSKLFPREAYWEQQQRAYSRQAAAEPPRPDVLEQARAACRSSGPHDSGMHIEICPDATDMPPFHEHRASCHGSIGELLCGHP